MILKMLDTRKYKNKNKNNKDKDKDKDKDNICFQCIPFKDVKDNYVQAFSPCYYEERKKRHYERNR